MKKLAHLAVLTIVAVAGSGAAIAQPLEKVTFRGGIAFISPTSNVTIDGSKVEVDSTIGPDVSMEYRFNERFGFEASSFYGRHDMKLDGNKRGKISQVPLLLTANFHFGAGKLDFYAGPTLGYAFWGDLKLPGGGAKLNVGGEVVYGGSAGLDVPFNDAWGFTAGLRYLKSHPTVNFGTPFPPGRHDIDVNPLVARVGVFARF